MHGTLDEPRVYNGQPTLQGGCAYEAKCRNGNHYFHLNNFEFVIHWNAKFVGKLKWLILGVPYGARAKTSMEAGGINLKTAKNTYTLMVCSCFRLFGPS